jgi:hypothetical protein
VAAAPEPYPGAVFGVLRRLALPLACFAAAGVIGVAAIADHVKKQARMDRAEVGEWYCAHEGTRCGGPSSDSIESHWNERQVGYEVAVSVLGAVGVVAFARALVRDRVR